MEGDSCELTGGFGVFVQCILALLVILVLGTEWLVERCLSENPRTFYKWWFDAYKICCGAFLSHCINILVAIYLKAKVQGNADACALYGLSYYYESTGVTFVSLLQYSLVKYAHTKEGNVWWGWISNPGKYPPDKVDTRNPVIPEDHHNFALDVNDRYMWRVGFGALFLSVIAGVIVGAFFTFLIGLGTTFCFFIFIFTTCAAPWASRIQVLAWCIMKIFEKSIWAGYVMIQASQLEKWSKEMSMENKKTEAVVYLAVMPMFLNVFMFLMFSQISRLQIPGLTLESAKPSDPFNVKEAMKIGIVYTFIINLILYVVGICLIRTMNAVGILFLTMLLLPLVTSGVFIFFMNMFIPGKSVQYQNMGCDDMEASNSMRSLN